MADPIVASFLDWSMRDPKAIAVVVVFWGLVYLGVWASSRGRWS